ncbi:cache domain-containing protein [Guyparkeria sp.]|uniref:cache domain-containing protein n=1 Tax=Guyparkeria sp. TaxID=2035736 RepID=UPI0035613628
MLNGKPARMRTAGSIHAGGARRVLMSAVLTMLLVVTTGVTQAETAVSHEQLSAFVKEAVHKLSQEGEAAFEDFRRRGGEWFQGDRYVFVWGLDGTRYVYPPDPAAEGRNMLGLRDINDKPIGVWFVEQAATEPGHGWVHYQWPRPNELFPSWKSTYIERAVGPDGERYLVGSGQYDMPLTRAILIDLVDDAAKLLEERGQTAFARLRDASDEFIFMDTYVFVLDTAGTELVNPAFPNLEGRNLMDYEDAAGNRLVKEMITRTEGGSAWVEYYWPRPGSAESVRKVAHVRRVRVKDEEWVVGAGMYEAR